MQSFIWYYRCVSMLCILCDSINMEIIYIVSLWNFFSLSWNCHHLVMFLAMSFSIVMLAGSTLRFRGGYLQFTMDIHDLQRMNSYVFLDPVIISPTCTIYACTLRNIKFEWPLPWHSLNTLPRWWSIFHFYRPKMSTLHTRHVLIWNFP